MKFVRALAFATVFAASPSLADPAIQWSGWNNDLFSRATSEKRFVILDLEAVWCHWCHVMEKTTYSDPKVIELLDSKYLPVRVDQDANPDLSNRYGDWGWPATIVFNSDGTEIAKIRGYIEPERMQALLKAVIDDPSPGPSVGEAFEVKPSASAFLTKEERATLIKNYDESYEDKIGGWGDSQKYIDADSMDYALSRAEAGDDTATARARQLPRPAPRRKRPAPLSCRALVRRVQDASPSPDRESAALPGPRSRRSRHPDRSGSLSRGVLQRMFPAPALSILA